MFIMRQRLQRLTVRRGIRRMALAYITIGAIGLSCAMFYILNATLDESSEQVHTVPMIKTDYLRVKINDPDYFAVFPTVTESRIGYFTLDKNEHFLLKPDQYKALQGKTAHANIIIKQGFFAMPWVVSKKIVPDITTTEQNGTWQEPAVANEDFLSGDKYYKGTGEVKDYAQAAHFFTKAAEVGDARAQIALAPIVI